MLKTLTSLLSLTTLQKAENHPVHPQLEAPLQIFPTEFVMHPLGNPFRKDIFVHLDRDIEILHFDNPTLFRNPLGNCHTFVHQQFAIALVPVPQVSRRSAVALVHAGLTPPLRRSRRSAVALVPVRPTSPTRRYRLAIEAHPRAAGN